MPAMNAPQIDNRRVNIAGMARSYGFIEWQCPFDRVLLSLSNGAQGERLNLTSVLSQIGNEKMTI